MECGNGNNTNTSQELVIYDSITWNFVVAGEEINRASTMVCNAIVQITQYFAHLQKAEEDFRLLAIAREEEDMMEIENSKMRNYYETLSNKASKLF
jgi:hypothetical protein